MSFYDLTIGVIDKLILFYNNVIRILNYEVLGVPLFELVIGGAFVAIFIAMIIKKVI